jgi:hypothetical protein
VRLDELIQGERGRFIHPAVELTSIRGEQPVLLRLREQPQTIQPEQSAAIINGPGNRLAEFPPPPR